MITKLTPSDPPCKTCGRPADAHSEKAQRCPEPAAGMFAVYVPVQH